MDRRRILGKWFFLGMGILCVCVAIFFISLSVIIRPSHNRDWSLDQAVLPSVVIDGDAVLVRNVRNFTYASTTSYTANYYDKTFHLSELVRAWYVVEPFSGIPGSAHTFLSFEFEGPEFLAVSVEIRKEKGEAFHPLKGLLNQYELMYVLADERDVVKLRSNFRNDLVYLYPARATKEKVQTLFLDIMRRVNELYEKPEFYNTLFNTCTTNIVRHVNTVTPDRVPLLRWQILFPENSDKLAYNLGLIDTNLPFEEARKRFFINDRALTYADDPDFSIKIRGEE